MQADKIIRLGTRDLPAAIALLAEGMQDNLLHIRVFGADPQIRQLRLRRLFAVLLPHVLHNGNLYGIREQGRLVAMLGMMEPGFCRPGPLGMLIFAFRLLLANPPAVSWRTARWLLHWARRDPAEPHWHLGPMAVLPARRRNGLARRLMTLACELADARGQRAWLETDAQEIVAFYQSLGFAVVCHEKLLGIPTWFMLRKPQGQQGQSVLNSAAASGSLASNDLYRTG